LLFFFKGIKILQSKPHRVLAAGIKTMHLFQTLLLQVSTCSALGNNNKSCFVNGKTEAPQMLQITRGFTATSFSRKLFMARPRANQQPNQGQKPDLWSPRALRSPSPAAASDAALQGWSVQRQNLTDAEKAAVEEDSWHHTELLLPG